MKQIQQIKLVLMAMLMLSGVGLHAQILDKSWRDITNKAEGDWFASAEAKDIADNVLLYQRDIGGWPKNIQMQASLSETEKQELKALKSTSKGATTDNGATYNQMLFLSKVNRAQPDSRYVNSFLKGLDYLLEAQYESGGWPQFYPLKKGYYTHITYNDDSMVNILNILQNIKNETNYFSIQPSEAVRKKVATAFQKGIECILNTQYKQNGVLTAWCAQHDENTLLPAKARAYELPSLSGAESANIVLLLMSIENPSKEVIHSVNMAVAWFEKTKITGLREDRTSNAEGKTISKKMVADENAPPIWARFMELDDNTPFFSDRDGIKKATLAEIGDERRNGYAWYKTFPQKVLDQYPAWKKKWDVQKNKTPKDPFNVVVSKDGTGDFTSVQEAIDQSKSFPYERISILIKNGTYHEKVNVHEWNPNITLIGESKDQTIISYDDYFDKINLGRNSTFYSPTVLVEADQVILKNLTIENTAGHVGQAVALAINSDKVSVVNCNLLGNQDTLYASGQGKQFFKDCYIEGTTDFIFGNATALFENCQIHSKKDSYITAASTPKGNAFGFVFIDCKLTAMPNVKDVYLGRPWRIFAKTVFINCDLGGHVSSLGWDNWSKPEAENTSFYAEFDNHGSGAQPKKRVKWSHQLTKTEAKNYSKQSILGTDKKASKNEWYEAL